MSLDIEQATKVYRGGVTAVDRLDLHVNDGELLVLVGPSGCGKTTTLRLIAGLEKLTSGTIRVGDRVVNDLAPADRGVAMVFQDHAMYPHLTVLENLTFALRLRGVARDERRARAREAASLLGIEDLLPRRPATLSGGQRQRVALGRAITADGQCVLLDEPLGSLDAPLRRALRAELKTLQRRLGRTMLSVTHDQEEALALADRIAVMDEGRIRQVATPDEIRRDPADAFVAGFMGAA